jgi:hypothetical protein
MGEWSYSSTILNLGSRWNLLESFSCCPFLPPGGNNPSGTPCLEGSVDITDCLNAVKQKITFPLPGIEIQFLGCPARCLVAIWT